MLRGKTIEVNINGTIIGTIGEVWKFILTKHTEWLSTGIIINWGLSVRP